MSTLDFQPRDTFPEPVPATPPRDSSIWQRFLLAARIAHVRLRFILVFVIIFVVVGERDLLRNYWDKLTGRARQLDTTAHAVSVDTEYFCPMDPGVISDWSGKCGICNMALVRRKKGEMVQLPDGVVARMQLSPYRVQLAGIQTAPVSFRPLIRPIEAVGQVSTVKRSEGDDHAGRAVVLVRVFERDIPFIAAGQSVELVCDSIVNVTMRGTVLEIDPAEEIQSGSLPVGIGVEEMPGELRVGMSVVARVHVPAADIEPFRSMARRIAPVAPGGVREVFVCAEHPDILKVKPGNCPIGKNRLDARTLRENERVDWWCPMHPKVVSHQPGAECAECEGMKLLPRVLTSMPVGEVLAVPESAVIDTGDRRVVYVERSRGMFEGVEVVLGPRCAEFYPVIEGLEGGERVATTGSFLIDAETRLNPGAATSYFGAAKSEAKP